MPSVPATAGLSAAWRKAAAWKTYLQRTKPCWSAPLRKRDKAPCCASCLKTAICTRRIQIPKAGRCCTRPHPPGTRIPSCSPWTFSALTRSAAISGASHRWISRSRRKSGTPSCCCPPALVSRPGRASAIRSCGAVIRTRPWSGSERIITWSIPHLCFSPACPFITRGTWSTGGRSAMPWRTWHPPGLPVCRAGMATGPRISPFSAEGFGSLRH